jgi:hypothetical protein
VWECRLFLDFCQAFSESNVIFIPSRETTARGMGLVELAEKEDPVALDSSLTL